MSPVRDGAAMISSMAPELDPATYVFCTTGTCSPELLARALGSFREAEGVSLILPIEAAEASGIDTLPMRRITLTVHSALDGVGLTAAVAGALAAAGIACNMVAAFHHDHVFVPAADAERAMTVLQALQEGRLGGKR